MIFAVALFSLDGLEQLNHARGRLEGDRALRAVATALRAACRSSDTAARLRGDEFALILPELDEASGRRTAEHVSAEVAGIDSAVSLSFGVAAWPEAGEGKDLLLVRADMALHASKKAPAEPAGGGGQRLAPESTQRIERVLALARRQLGMDLTFLGEFRDGKEVLRAVEGDAASFGVEAGTEVPLPETYCQRMADGRIDCAVPDAAADAELAALAMTREAGIGSYLGVPLRLPDGHLYGALCGLSHARRGFSARQVELMRFLAELVTELLDQEAREARRHRAQLETSGIHALVAALEARDHYTGEHSRTVVRLATAVSERLGLSEEEALEVEQVAILHDIGKVGIPDRVLQKRGPLTDGEWELMRQTPRRRRAHRRLHREPRPPGPRHPRRARALGRKRLPGWPARRRAAPRQPHHPRVRRLPRHGLRPALPRRAVPGAGAHRAAGQRGDPVRPARGRGPPGSARPGSTRR